MLTIDKVHTFKLAQRVKFVGGEGIVRHVKFEAQNWTYLVEMPLGQEPEFGRVGAETMVLLSETELRAARV
jgi:hypothetical protein